MIEKQEEEIKSDVFSFLGKVGVALCRVKCSQLLDCFLQSVWHPLTGVSNDGLGAFTVNEVSNFEVSSFKASKFNVETSNFEL